MDRYWVGGTGTWNTSSTTNWSATSGGGSGASVPTVADSVFFDQAGTYTVTMTGALACLDITVSAGTVTFATGTTPTLNVRGSMSLLAGTVWSSTGTITFSSTTTGRTVTTNGVTISGVIDFNGVGGGWTLGSALSTSALANIGVTVTAGTFDTGNYNLTARFFSSSNSNTRTVNLGSSTITLNNDTATSISFLTSTGLTFNAGTSSFVITTPGTVNGGGQTFYNISFTSTSSANVRAITGANTFNNLAITGPSSAGVVNVTFAAQQTINGTLSTTGTAGNRRVFFASATYGISQDLVVNSTPSLTDADFRGLYVRGTAAPISGTRIGNRGECRGITFDAPKIVYANLVLSSFYENIWATSSGGTPSLVNFPLPQDTAIINNASGNSGFSIGFNINYIPTLDMSLRTTALSFSFGNTTTAYGNFVAGSGVTFSGSNSVTFSGGTTQTITSAGKTFSCPITVDTYGGTVQLADALNIGSSSLTVTNGTFTTAGYAVTAGTLSSSNSNVRTINLGASVLTLTLSGGSPVNFTTSTNLTLNTGTSQVTLTSSSAFNFHGGGLIFYNVALTGTSSVTHNFTGANTFNNLTYTAPASVGLTGCNFSANQTINGTLTCAGASAVRRIFLRSETIGTPRTLTVNAISATDCDFRDIILAGTASGASPTRAGNCGGNTGITFPAAKTVYWNLAGAQNWSATAWAPGSGGLPDINNFPLAQDTAVFDEAAGSVTGTITINAAWNIGTFDASLRTSAMTLSTSTNAPVVYGDWKFGTGVTSSSTTGTINFVKNGTQTITSNGVQFGCPVTINHPLANVQLADALSFAATRTLTLNAGTFDAVTYNVTTSQFANNSSSNTVRMGSGTWTLFGSGTVWNMNGSPTLIVGTSTIVLSDTSTSSRTFVGGSLYYNKLTIGGATGTSTLTINNNNTFGELAATKTVAHTIDFGTTIQTFGKWSVTGTAGNVVTITGTSTTNVIAGPAVTGVDYLAMGTWGISTTSPGEFYAGANSTGTAAAPVFRTAAPAPRTLYWVGGTGNWSSTTKWSTSSGGGSGAAIPTSLDAVNFDSLSNATAYTATIDAGVTLARCASFTMAGPASGNVTFAGSVGIAFHGNVSFAATGITRTYNGAMQWAGNSSYTFTTNGVALTSSITVVGVGSTWTLGSALNNGTFSISVDSASFSTSPSNYSVSASALGSGGSSVRSIVLNASTLTFTSSPIDFNGANLTFNSGTSSIIGTGGSFSFFGNNQTFNNVSFTNVAATSISVNGANTFNTLSFAGRTSVGINAVTFNANQTISTLTLNAGTAAAFRTFLASDTIGTTRTLTVTTLTAGAADIDFRDITIAGAAAPISGTRFGDAKGNSGITFDAAKTVYYRQTGSANWGTTGTGSWSATSGGGFDATQFPLAQDTAIFPAATYPASGSTTTINANYNIGTIDMSLRTGNTMTLATGTTTPQIYGNWINGTGTTLTGTGAMTFAGRGSQTITSAGKTFTQGFTINTPSGSVTLQDAFVTSAASNFAHTQGTFDANGFNFTLSSSGSAAYGVSGTTTRTIAIGSGTWSIATSGTAFNAVTATNLTVTGTGTISLTSASAKTFAGGGISYSGITLNQGGAGALTITGNNTFKDITNTYSATGATSITLGATTQTLTNPWTATGAATRVLTVSGTSAASPGTLIFSGSGTAANVDYLTVSNVRAYPLVDDWYAGPNSTNSGSLGWYFVAAGGTVYSVTITETGTGTDSITARVTLLGTISETGTGTDSVSAGLQYLGAITETGTGTDSISGTFRPSATITETATGSDVESAILAAIARINETATGSDADSAQYTTNPSVSESATGTDTDSAKMTAKSTISENATVTDAASALATLLAAVSEAATATDLISAIQGLFAAILESATGTDSVDAPGSTYNPSLSELATGTDSVSALVVLVSQVAESATINDVTAAFKAYLAEIIEAASGADTVFSQFVARSVISEAATGTDTDSAKFTAQASIAETATGTDTESPRYIANPVIAETATGTDTDSAKYTARSNIAETTTGTDTLNTNATLNSSVDETAIAQEIVRGFMVAAVQISESATGTDQISALRALAAAVVETATVTDSLSAQAIFRGILQEIATLTDSVNAPGSTYSAPIIELATLQDVVRAAATFPASLTETATGTQTNSAAFIPSAQVFETATITDVNSALVAFAARVAENAVITDQVSPPGSIYNPVVLAVAQLVDNVSPAGSIYNAPVLESAAITDALIGAFLWNLIDDSQNPNWANITDSQTPGWVEVGTSQGTGWVTIPTPQNPGWSNIDDSQPPNWQNITNV
jgi:hypothetical protein